MASLLSTILNDFALTHFISGFVFFFFFLCQKQLTQEKNRHCWIILSIPYAFLLFTIDVSYRALCYIFRFLSPYKHF